jgi:hypothetical protein
MSCDLCCCCGAIFRCRRGDQVEPGRFRRSSSFHYDVLEGDADSFINDRVKNENSRWSIRNGCLPLQGDDGEWFSTGLRTDSDCY